MVKGQDRTRTETGREVDTDGEETGQDENRNRQGGGTVGE